MAKEKEYIDDELNFWHPEFEGDFVAGIYIAKEIDVGENKSNVYHIRQEDGVTISVWGSTVLDGKMLRYNAGDDIKIIYLGKKDGEGKGKRQYHNYKIQILKSIEDSKI